MVQRWPEVPIAPNTTAGIARFKSADSSMMTALLPLSSSKLFPKRSATAVATFLPTALDPVKETSGIRASLINLVT